MIVPQHRCESSRFGCGNSILEKNYIFDYVMFPEQTLSTQVLICLYIHMHTNPQMYHSYPYIIEVYYSQECRVFVEGPRTHIWWELVQVSAPVLLLTIPNFSPKPNPGKIWGLVNTFLYWETYKKNRFFFCYSV